jgi:uncharacterized protein DUF3592
MNVTFSSKSLLIFWLLSTLCAIALGVFMLEVPKYYAFETRGLKTEGRIIELQPQNHRAVVYRYQVDGRGFTGSGRAGDVYREFDELRVGQEIPVIYDPDDVSISCMGDPQRQLSSRLRGTAFLSAMPSLAMIILMIRKGAKADPS